MGFLKRNVFYIICGLVAGGSVALGVLGMTSMGKVAERMESIRTLHGQFASPSKKPANTEVIQAQQKRVETIQGQFAELMEKAKSLNSYEPMKAPEGEQFFPTATDNGRRQFAEIYGEKFDEMLERLRSGVPPTPEVVKAVEEEMREEQQIARGFGDDKEKAGETKPKEKEKEEPAERPSGLITDAAARKSAATRASIRRAREIYCYASPETFQVVQEVFEGLSPRPNDMWRAQLTLWIQQDVVNGLARVNESAADELRARDETAWVGVLPVKDVLSIRVSEYVPSSATVSPSREVTDDDPVEPYGSADVVFTKTKSTDLYEVVQFAVKLVVDSRDLPRIIDEICRDRFHTLLGVQYEYERSAFENLRMEGKIYGSEPVVKLVLDFETVFFGDPYRCMMPESVRAAIAKECPKKEGES
ncbi:MAG: hypothetical protein HOP29_13420 [Phycisphaerales bacterium]|nr:hypothetical protein [Phycisphaerales bacterium]